MYDLHYWRRTEVAQQLSGRGQYFEGKLLKKGFKDDISISLFFS